jgi:2-desacetyl-2-hydroxyethyl bacteriochlorophyllide A dehydrogenase
MLAVCFQGVEQVSLQRLPDPEIAGDGDAIVEVQLAGLCGSDLHPFFGREVGLDPGTAMGHEFVGRVTEVGAGVSRIRPGDRVASPFTTNCGECFYCRSGLTSRCPRGQLFGWRSDGVGLHGGQAERVRVPLADATLVRIPEGVTAETALLLGDNLATGYYGADLAIDQNHAADDVLAVIGCGTVGLLAIEACGLLGARRIIAIDPNASRCDWARQRGADAFTDPRRAAEAIEALTEGRGADGVMEFVGLPEAQRLAYRLVRPGGRMSVIGCHCEPQFSFSPAEAYDKNLTIRTGRCPARHYMDVLLERMKLSDLKFDWCISHRFKPAQARQAYQTFAYRESGCVKAVIEF